jgi:hypothetical protein
MRSGCSEYGSVAFASEARSVFSMLTRFLLTIGLLLPSFAYAANPCTTACRNAVDATFETAISNAGKLPFPGEGAASVSNVLKTKHDTVKNSINNIR